MAHIMTLITQCKPFMLNTEWVFQYFKDPLQVFTGQWFVKRVSYGQMAEELKLGSFVGRVQ